MFPNRHLDTIKKKKKWEKNNLNFQKKQKFTIVFMRAANTSKCFEDVEVKEDAEDIGFLVKLSSWDNEL